MRPVPSFSAGTIGEVRSDNGKDTKVYLSNDGGYTWKVGRVPSLYNITFPSDIVGYWCASWYLCVWNC